MTVLLAALAAACTNTSDSSTSTSSSSSSGAASSRDQASSTTTVSGGSSSGGVSGSASSTVTQSSSAQPQSSSAQTCPQAAFTLCDMVPPDREMRTITTDPMNGALGISGLATVGMTRGEVRTLFGTDMEQLLPGENGGGSPLPFRVFYCAKRISITYADTPDAMGNFDGALSDNDVVHRIAVFEGFAGKTDTDIALGDASTEVTTAYGEMGTELVTTNQPVLGGTQTLYPKKGLAFTHDLGVVTAIAVHKPYVGTAAPTPANAALDLDQLRIGTISAKSVNGSQFSAVKAAFGEPDAQGFTTVQNNRIGLLSYSNLGLRFVSLDMSGNATDIDTQQVAQVYITPPYSGVDPSNVLGLGATRAEWDAAGYENLGDTMFGGVNFARYKVGELFVLDLVVGVSFVEDETCTPRAAVIVLNFISQ